MPHYADGCPAKVGDVVRGKGYNIPHEIVGTVLRVQPGQEECNLSVAVARVMPMGPGATHGMAYVDGNNRPLIISADIEYSAAKDFLKIAEAF